MDVNQILCIVGVCLNPLCILFMCLAFPWLADIENEWTYKEIKVDWWVSVLLEILKNFSQFSVVSEFAEKLEELADEKGLELVKSSSLNKTLADYIKLGLKNIDLKVQTTISFASFNVYSYVFHFVSSLFADDILSQQNISSILYRILESWHLTSEGQFAYPDNTFMPDSPHRKSEKPIFFISWKLFRNWPTFWGNTIVRVV